MEDNIDNNNQLWGEGNFAVHARVYGKFQVEPTVNPNDQGRRNGEERYLFSPLLACLATYVGCVLCASLSRLGGDTHSTALSKIFASSR